MKSRRRNLFFAGAILLLLAAVAVCSVLMMETSFVYSLVMLVCSFLIAAATVAEIFFLNKSKGDYSKKISQDVAIQNSESVFKTLNPVCGIKSDGSLAWYNSSFKEMFSDALDKKIGELIPEIRLDAIYENGSLPPIVAKIGKEFYNIVPIVNEKTDYGHASVVLFFEKVTELLSLKKQVEDERTAVAEVIIDNLEEATADIDDEERIDLITLLDKNIVGWAQDNGGLVKKIENNRFLCVFNKAAINKFIEDKFEILLVIRSVYPGIKIQPTVSIGIGMCDGSLYENDLLAKKALEMALGRGGDQVVIAQKDKFSYFGGNSRETEKRTKVKSRIMAHNLHEMISASDNVIIMGHRNGDTDSVGSAMGIASMSAYLGKDAKIVLSSRDSSIDELLKKINENHYHDNLIIDKSEVRDHISPKSLLVICDTHIPDYTEMPELLNIIQTKFVIDHHRRSEKFITNADIVYHEPFASSTCEMVAELMQYFDPGYSVSTVDAEALYSGIVIDTKNFTVKTGVRTFEAAAYLRSAGVDTLRIKQLFRESIDNYRLKACIVTETQVIRDNIAISVFSGIVPHVIVASAADEMLDITGVKASFVVARAKDGSVNVSGRSWGDVNVQLILEKLGGGGHMMVAGAQLEGISVTDAGEKLKQAIDEVLQ